MPCYRIKVEETIVENVTYCVVAPDKETAQERALNSAESDEREFMETSNRELLDTREDALTVLQSFELVQQVLEEDDAPTTLADALTIFAWACYRQDLETWIDVGEFADYRADELLAGAYWALVEWHGGQDSDTYAAMCAINAVFDPGGTDGPEPDSGEVEAYNAIDAHYRAKHPDKA